MSGEPATEDPTDAPVEPAVAASPASAVDEADGRAALQGMPSQIQAGCASSSVLDSEADSRLRSAAPNLSNADYTMV